MSCSGSVVVGQWYSGSPAAGLGYKCCGSLVVGASRFGVIGGGRLVSGIIVVVR